jgi:hypothetical protein
MVILFLDLGLSTFPEDYQELVEVIKYQDLLLMLFLGVFKVAESSSQ